MMDKNIFASIQLKIISASCLPKIHSSVKLRKEYMYLHFNHIVSMTYSTFQIFAKVPPIDNLCC